MSSQSYTPILEIYKIRISPRKRSITKSFRNIYEEKFNSKDSSYKKFSKALIEHFEEESYIINNLIQKGFTIWDKEGNHNLHFKIEENIIYGTMHGGKYGKKRKKGSINNTRNSEEIKHTDVILDDYYFLLYTPYENNTGLLFIQKYSSESITILFKNHLSSFLDINNGLYNKPQFDTYIPKEIEDEFKKESVINKIVYSTNILANEYIEDQTGNLTIKVSIESKNGIPKEEKATLLERLNLKKFDNKNLKDFKHSTGYLKNIKTDRSVSFKIEDDFNFKPVIDLSFEDVKIDEFGVPDFDSLHKYCYEILEELKSDESIFPYNDIREL